MSVSGVESEGESQVVATKDGLVLSEHGRSRLVADDGATRMLTEQRRHSRL